MNQDDRQRMNVRTIRVSLRSALRYIGPEQAELCIGRAQQLLGHARERASSAALVAEIEALQAELDGGRLEDRKES